jgi:hypothetical protein
MWCKRFKEFLPFARMILAFMIRKKEHKWKHVHVLNIKYTYIIWMRKYEENYFHKIHRGFEFIIIGVWNAHENYAEPLRMWEENFFYIKWEHLNSTYEGSYMKNDCVYVCAEKFVKWIILWMCACMYESFRCLNGISILEKNFQMNSSNCGFRKKNFTNRYVQRTKQEVQFTMCSNFFL